MTNPWLKISPRDYEGHMSSVGQLQMLNQILQKALNTYRPENIAVLGATTGNGFEHIEPTITKRIHAIDINKEFLELSLKRYRNVLPGLTIHNVDLNTEKLNIPLVEFVFAALIFEYVKPEVLIPKILNIVKPLATVVVIIQSTPVQSNFVSTSKYNALALLSSVASEINKRLLVSCFHNYGFNLKEEELFELENKKKFIKLNFKKEI